MSLRLKIKCPLCDMNRWSGTIDELNLSNAVSLPETDIINIRSNGRGKIHHLKMPLSDFHGKAAITTRKLQREILKNYRRRAMELIELIDEKMEQL